MAVTVTAISPDAGTYIGGTAVTITGTGFVAGATVSIGGTSATNVVVVGATSITAVTGAHALDPAYSAVNVVVTNVDLSTGTGVGLYLYERVLVLNYESSPPFQTPLQWALQRFDFRPRKEGKGNQKGEET